MIGTDGESETSYFIQRLDNNIFLYKKILKILAPVSLIFLVRNIVFFFGIDKLSPYYFSLYLTGAAVTISSYLLLSFLYKKSRKRAAHICLLCSCAAVFFLFLFLSFLDSAFLKDTDLTAYSMGLLLIGFMLRIDFRVSALISSLGMVIFLSLISRYTYCQISFESVIPLGAINIVAVYFSYIRENFFHNLYKDKEIIEKESRKDSLTGVYNRRYMKGELDRLLDLKRHHDVPFCCLFLDIDFFKSVNDEFGHTAEDGVLKKFAEILTGAVRSADRVIRYGGEEFVIILADTDLAQAQVKGEKLRRKIETTPFPPVSTPITTSIGITEARALDDVKALVDRADYLLYQAKKEGRNRCCFGRDRPE